VKTFRTARATVCTRVMHTLTHMDTSYKWTRVSYVDLVSGLFCVFFTGYPLGTKYCITYGIFVLRVFSWLFLFAFLVNSTASACSERLVSEVPHCPHSVLKGTLNPTQCPASNIAANKDVLVSHFPVLQFTSHR